MAAETLYGANYTATEINVPSEKAGVGENIGKIHFSFDSFSPATADGEYEVGDVVKMFKLPKGARVIDVIAAGPSLGTTGIFKVGYEANGVDVADDDGFIASVDLGGQAATVSMTDTENAAAQFKKFTAETQVILTFTEASTANTGTTISLCAIYSMA